MSTCKRSKGPSVLGKILMLDTNEQVSRRDIPDERRLDDYMTLVTATELEAIADEYDVEDDDAGAFRAQVDGGNIRLWYIDEDGILHEMDEYNLKGGRYSVELPK